MKKRNLAFLLALCLLVTSFVFVGCSNKAPEAVNDQNIDILVIDEASEENSIMANTMNLEYYFSTEAATQYDSGYRYAEMSMQQLADMIWMLPTHIIVEVPSEIWTNGVVKWQQVSLDWVHGGSTLFQFVRINTANGQFSIITGRVTLAQIGNITVIEMDAFTTQIVFPAARRVWAAQN